MATRIISKHLPSLPKFLTIAAFSALLGACYDDARPSTSAPMALTSTEGVASLRGSGPGYTRHDPLAQQTEVLAIRLGTGLEIGERAKILRAVNEWNHALNGLVRLDIVPSPGDAMPMQAGTGSPFGRIWTIIPMRGSAATRGQLTGMCLPSPSLCRPAAASWWCMSTAWATATLAPCCATRSATCWAWATSPAAS